MAINMQKRPRDMERKIQKRCVDVNRHVFARRVFSHLSIHIHAKIQKRCVHVNRHVMHGQRGCVKGDVMQRQRGRVKNTKEMRGCE